MNLRFELFVKDIQASTNFYQNMLGFQIDFQSNDSAYPYIQLINGNVRIGLGLHSNLPENHSVRSKKNEIGKGIEIVLEVDHVEQIYKSVLKTGHEDISPIMEQLWGLVDF